MWNFAKLFMFFYLVGFWEWNWVENFTLMQFFLGFLILNCVGFIEFYFHEIWVNFWPNLKILSLKMKAG